MLHDVITAAYTAHKDSLSVTAETQASEVMSQAYKIYGGVNRRARGNADSHLRRRMLAADHSLPAPEFLTDEDIDRLVRVGGICAGNKNFYSR